MNIDYRFNFGQGILGQALKFSEEHFSGLLPQRERERVKKLNQPLLDASKYKRVTVTL